MHNRLMSFRALAVTCTYIALASSMTAAATVEITVTNQSPAGGFSFSPVWFGVHDGTFDTFDSGSAASAAVEAIAELANTSGVETDFTGVGPQTTLPSPGGPYTPGATASTNLAVVDPTTNRYLSFLAMIVPSNDFFMGNDTPTGVELFDGAGNFTGPLTINVFGGDVWDAGTEVNDLNDGIAFIVGSDATMGTDENGTIGFALPGANSFLATLVGESTAGGYDISAAFGELDLIATIEIQEVPEPSSLTLAGIGVFFVLAAARRRRLH